MATLSVGKLGKLANVGNPLSSGSSLGGSIASIGNPLAAVGNSYVDKQTASSVKKLNKLGAEVPKPRTSVLGWLLENLPRTGYAGSNLLREFTQPSAGYTPNDFDPLAAWMRGFKKVETTTGKDIMEGFGLSGDKALIGGGDPHIYNPSPAGLAGLALDIFNPADPINWVGFGLGGAAKTGGIKGVTALEKSFGKGSAATIASLLGDDAIADIGANSVGKIIRQITEKGKSGGLDEQGMSDLVEALKSGMGDAKTNPRTKINYWQGKPLTVGIQNPLTLGLKGNIAEAAIPGSEHLTGAISKGMNRFSQTKVGDTLGEMFKFGHVSKDAPQRLFVKDAAQNELNQMVRSAIKNKSKLPVSADEIQALKNDLNSISISNIYDETKSSGGYNFDVMAGITGINTDTLMKMFENDLPFTYSVGELFSKLKTAGSDDATAFRQAFLLRGVMDKTIDLIPNEFRKLFKGTVMTPSIDIRFGDNSMADGANIYGPNSAYINFVFEHKGVGIALPVNTSENFNKAMWDKLAEAVKVIDGMEPELRAKIAQDIQISPHELGEYADKFGNKVIDPSAATFARSKIVLVDADRFAHAIPHETGHLIWQNNPELAGKYSEAADNEINNLNSSIGVTNYGFRHIADHGNYEEDFAESVARLIKDPAGFIEEHPERSRVVQEALADGTITPEEAQKIVEASDARAQKITNAYGAERQLDMVVSKIDQATTDVFTKGADQSIDNKQAMSQFTKDLTRIFEKTVSDAEDFQKAVKVIWKDVPEEERRQIIRIAATFDNKIEDPAFYTKIDDELNPTFHSVLRNIVDTKMANAMPVEDLRRMLKSNGVKDEEMQWTFMDEFFEGKQRVTKVDVQQWLDWNSLQVEERMLGGSDQWEASGGQTDTHYGQYVEPGGQDYKELLIKLPKGYNDPAAKTFDYDRFNQLNEEDDLLNTKMSDLKYKYPNRRYGETGTFEAEQDKAFRTELKEYRTRRGEIRQELKIMGQPPDLFTPDYEAPHFGGPERDDENLVAHTRFNTRTTADGKKILFVEEIQSDWHQHGWREGYKVSQEEFNKKARELAMQIQDLDKKRDARLAELQKDGNWDVFEGDFDDELMSINDQQVELSRQLRKLHENEGVADAPFKNTWRELVIKRLLKYASQEGFDGIAWTSGAQQNARWHQTSVADAIRWNPESKMLSTYDMDPVTGQYTPSEHVQFENEKDLKKYLTQEQIAHLTDNSDPEWTIEPKTVSVYGETEDAFAGMAADEMLRGLMKRNNEKTFYVLKDKKGNELPYHYESEKAAQDALETMNLVDPYTRSLSGGSQQWGGGGFRLTYDERIPQDFEKLTKKFKLKTEDIELGTTKSNPKVQETIDDPDALDIVWDVMNNDNPQGVADDFEQIINYVGGAESLSRGELEKLNGLYMKTLDEYLDTFPAKLRLVNQAKRSLDIVYNNYKGMIPEAEEKIAMNQKGIMLTPEARDFFADNTQPLFLAKQRTKPAPVLNSMDEALDGLSENGRNAYNEFIKWRESIVKEYGKREIPINVLEKYVPFVFIRKGNADEMSALNALFGTGSMPESDELSSLINWLSGYDPNLKTRTTQATDPTEVNKVLNKPILSEDGGVIMATRGTRAIQAMELYDFADEFAGKYGMTIDEMSQWKNMKGYKMYVPKVGADGRKVFEEVKASNITEGNEKAMFLPEEMVKMYNEYTDLVFGKQGMNKLLKTYDKATSLYKKLAYLWNPGHIMRDFTGNVFNGYLMGLTNPAYYKEAFDYMTKPDSMVKIPGLEMTAAEFMKKCRQNGVLDIGSSLAEFSGDSVVGIKKAKNPVTAALNGYGYIMRMGTRQSDTFTRMAGMIYQMKQGKSFEEAAVAVKKFYFDYFELTTFERNVMKRIVPFYTWMRKNIPLQLEMLVKNPRELSRVSKSMNAAAQEDIDWSEQPEYIQDSAAFPMANSDHYLSPNLPFTDLSRGTPTLDTLQNLLSSVSPLIRSPIELATNTQWFNGQPIEGYENEKREMPLSGLLRNVGVATPQINKRGMGYLADQIPLLRNLDAITDMSNPRQMEKASSFVGGPGLYKKDAVENAAKWEQLRRLQDLIRLLQDQQNQ